MVANNTFNWTILDDLLSGTASRNNHAVFSFFIDWPSKVGLAAIHLPQYLMESLEFIQYRPETEPDKLSPSYGDPLLLEAIEQFITALGARYDGDNRIYLIHLGLLGFWGEFRTFRPQRAPCLFTSTSHAHNASHHFPF